ncbi:hypothetical protein J4717_13855 [Phaeobacter sp. HS012]|uniref:HD domain-containing protein n=1 Tax=unclassified Phaeobacter TaxID=2621772 RepID=UPI001B385915|nr:MULTISPECIES: hypothetical protein [unclassified Phaeobacter]MBQ4808555.1 hypothetical protein [Phaeobacter sp. HS012]MBQ4883226.1 hypothetical protein [Phaeobacter sp. HS011]
MTEGYDITFNRPLELLLEKHANDPETSLKFPQIGTNRFDLYKQMKSKLQDGVYRDVQSGLTADANGAAFTRHDLGHVDDVIRKAGELLGVDSSAKTPAFKNLEPFEVFALLTAILVHDAGNIDGRARHEARARKVLKQVSNDRLSQKELKIISAIAKAHGGKNADGSRDKIEQLEDPEQIDSFKVRSKLLAAVLRFSDELAENFRRANNRTEDSSKYPNMFCQCISVGVDYDSRRVKLDFAVANEACELEAKDEAGEKMFFVDYIKKRIRKTELERRYCDRFMRNFASFEETRVVIDFLHDDEEWHDINFILKESGFPSEEGDIFPEDHEFSGEDIANLYREHRGEEQDA